jgi:hypothetical protein
VLPCAAPLSMGSPCRHRSASGAFSSTQVPVRLLVTTSVKPSAAKNAAARSVSAVK